MGQHSMLFWKVIEKRYKCIKTEIPLTLNESRGTLQKTAATYSPTVTQYHRRDEA